MFVGSPTYQCAAIVQPRERETTPAYLSAESAFGGNRLEMQVNVVQKGKDDPTRVQALYPVINLQFPCLRSAKMSIKTLTIYYSTNSNIRRG